MVKLYALALQNIYLWTNKKNTMAEDLEFNKNEDVIKMMVSRHPKPRGGDLVHRAAQCDR